MTTTTATSSTTAANTTGSSIITSLNAGSGIDTGTLVTSLTAAQKSALEDGITAKQTANTAQISAAANVASYVTQFSTALDSLISGGTLMSTPTSSDTSVATATAIAGSKLGSLTASIHVDTLATAQVVKSGTITGFPTASAGTLTIRTAGTTTGDTTTGSTSTDVAIPANASVSDMATAINAAKTGVTASVVNGVLVMKGATGAANAFTVTSSGEPALAQFAYGSDATATPSATSMGYTSQAADAALTVDGVAVTSASNTLTNVVQGVTLTIVKSGDVTLTGARPTDAITAAVNDFVSAYNLVQTQLAAATAAATSTTDAGALRGNSSIRDMQRQLGKLTTQALSATGSITTLAQLGVKTAQDGTLSVDSATLATILAKYPDDVEAMFNPAQSSSSGTVAITSKVGAVAAGVYTLTGLTAASGGNPSAGSIDGIAATGLGSTLSAATGSAAAGLTLSLASGATFPSSVSLTIDLGLGGALALIKTNLVGTNGSLTAFQKGLATQTSTLADQLTAADAKLTVYHDRLVSQFSTMNTRVSAYKATASYLTQQVDLWTKSTN